MNNGPYKICTAVLECENSLSAQVDLANKINNNHDKSDPTSLSKFI
jgi:hypothetical protein